MEKLMRLGTVPLNTAGKDEKTREENLVLRQNLAMMGIIFMTASVATADDVGGSDIPVPSSSGSVAEEEPAPDYARRGVHLEVDGQAMVNVFRGGEPGHAASGGVGARAGWHVGSRVAVELQYEWIDQLQNDSANLMTINGKIFILTGRIQPFARVGLGAIFGDVPGESSMKSSFVARFGLGGDFWIDENWAVTVFADYVLPTSHFHRLNFISTGAGIRYRF